MWKEVDVEVAKQQIIKDQMKFDSQDKFFEYFEQICNQELDRTKPLFQFRLIEDYTEDTSMVMFLCPHAFCDGIAVSSIFSAINDDQFSCPHKKKMFYPSLIQKIILFFKTPFTNVSLEGKVDLIKTDDNTKQIFKLKRQVPTMTKYYDSEIEFPFSTIRKCYQKYKGMSFNDFMLGIFGKSIYQYCIKKGIKNPNNVKCEIPVGLKKLPTGYHDLVVKNYLNASVLDLPLSEDMEQIMNGFKPWLSYCLDPEIQKQVINFTHLVPYIPQGFAKSEINNSSKGVDVLLSNIPFSDKPYTICGKEVKKFRIFNNTMLGIVLYGFVFTYANKVCVTTCVDERIDFDGQMFQDLMIKNIQIEVDNLK